jgi:hypothetical protein
MEFGDNMSFTPPFNSNVFLKSHLFMTKLWVLMLCFFFYFNVVQVCRKMKRKKIGGAGWVLLDLNYVWKIHDFSYLREIMAIENLKNHFILAIFILFLTF